MVNRCVSDRYNVITLVAIFVTDLNNRRVIVHYFTIRPVGYLKFFQYLYIRQEGHEDLDCTPESQYMLVNLVRGAVQFVQL